MDDTAKEIEEHIDRTRDRLGANLGELEDKVDAAIDWREQYRERPYLFLGAAFVGGVVLANVLPTGPSRQWSADNGVERVAGGRHSIPRQALELWSNVQGALIGVVSARIKEYIDELVPGFDEHYRRAEQRAGAFDSSTTS